MISDEAIASGKEYQMKNLTTEMKKNVLRVIAGVSTAITLSAAPLTVSAAVRTNTMNTVAEANGGFLGNTNSMDVSMISCYALDDYYDFPSIYPGEYITNDFDEPMNLVFFDSDVNYYVMVTIPAGGEYLVQYQESASGITVETYDYWDCYDIEDNFFFFLPNTGF